MADEPDIGLMEELEYEGHGGEGQEQISGYVQGLAQEVSQQLESWMEGGVLTDGMLEPMIELLKQVFVDFEHYYVQSLQADELMEEKESLQNLLHDMKQKYQSTVERHNAYVDQLEQENREKKHNLHQLRENNADLTSRLMTAKSSLEELQDVYEQAKSKHKEESRKLYNAVEFYRSSGEHKDQIMSLKRSSRSSVKAKGVEVAHSLAVTSGIPLIPGSDRSFSPDPSEPVSHEEQASSLAVSERSSLSEAAGEQVTNKRSLQKELDSMNRSHGDVTPEQSVPSLLEHAASFDDSEPTAKNDELSDENETSEGDQPPLLESDQLKEQIEDSENFSYSWVELENTASAVTHRETAHGKRPPALSLAQEFELLAPEEFAQTEMQQILEQRDEAVHEKEKLVADKQKMHTDLEAFRNQNMELKKIIEEYKTKEQKLSEELASARRDHEMAIQESFLDEDLGNVFAFTKKEMFIKIKELMQLKKRCHFLEEDNRNLQKLLNEKKTPKQKSLLSAILDKVFGRSKSTPRHDISVKEQKTPVKPPMDLSRSFTPTMLPLQPLQGISLEGYTLCNNWLLGYRANGVMSSLPDYIGRILLKGLEISRIDCCAVARVTEAPSTPDSFPKDSVLSATSPVVKPSKSPHSAAASSCGHCTAEVWVATSFESVSHIEVISVFSPTEKQVQKQFVTKCQHIQCMMAIPGHVPLSEEYRKRSRSSLSPPPVSELSLVSDNKDPLRKETDSPDGRTEGLIMWIVSDTNKLYFHSVGKDCHRELNSVDLQKGSYCIEYAGDRVFIGQSNGNLLIFNKSNDNCTWNIDKPFVVGISCPPPEQEISINYIKNIDSKLWIAIGQAIYIMDPLQLGIEVCNDDNRIIIDESKDSESGTFINCIEQVKDLAVISFFRRPIIKIYDANSGEYIKKIDVSSVCIILDKLPTSPNVSSSIARISTLSSNNGILYVGTRCGKLFAFSAKTLGSEEDSGEDSPDGRKKRRKLKKLAAAAEKEKEEAQMEYEKQLVEDINSCAISVYMHKFSLKQILCMSLPNPSQPNAPVVYNSLVVTVGKGHHHQSTKGSDGQARSPSPSDRLSDHCQLLAWGCHKEDANTTAS